MRFIKSFGTLCQGVFMLLVCVFVGSAIGQPFAAVMYVLGGWLFLVGVGCAMEDLWR